jgi:hypothetical protein
MTRHWRVSDLVGCGDEVSVEPSYPQPRTESGCSPWSAEQQWTEFREATERGSLGFEQSGVEACEDGEVRSGCLDCLLDRRDGCVGAEEQDAPAVRTKNEPEGDEGDVVSLSRGTGEQRERPAAAAPKSGE